MTVFLSNTNERIFTNLIKELADEKIFPSALYYKIEEEVAVIEISATEEDVFNQIFRLTPAEIFRKVERICFANGANEKEENKISVSFFIGSEIEVIVNK